MKVSVVTTMYYSRNYLHEFYNRTIIVLKELNFEYEFVFVDDGSPDDSVKVVLELQSQDANIVVVQLSRNFGHQKAIKTGLENATGDYVFLIDCDLEEDPALLKALWTKISTESDVDVVYGVQEKRKGAWFERISGDLFYWLISSISSIEYPADTLTSRIMTRRYVDAILSFREKEIDVWGVFAMAGFRQVSIPAMKGYKGSSTFTLKKKIKRAIEVITSISHRPLYFTFFLGLISFFVAFVNIVIIVYKKMYLHEYVEGWASIMASVWLVGGMILFVLGILGIYLSKMFLEIKNRPLTIIKQIYKK